MPRRALVLALSLLAAFADGAAEGRRGLRLLEAGDAAGAAAEFEAGLAATEGQPGPIRAALWNDLGLARYAQRQFAEAAAAFDEAAALAETPDVRARFAYNAGTALARADSLTEAAARLRRALVLTPGFPAARHNYEWVKRRRNEQGEPETESGETSPPPEPSAFARQLKAQADALVAARRYREALDLFEDGRARDSTVAAYQDVIQRLGDVVAIEEADAP